MRCEQWVIRPEIASRLLRRARGDGDEENVSNAGAEENMSGPDSTPVSFSRDEIDQLRDMMAKNLPIVCPICRGTMQYGEVVAGGGSQENVFAWTCESCNRTAILRDVTEKRQ